MKLSYLYTDGQALRVETERTGGRRKFRQIEGGAVRTVEELVEYLIV